MTNDNPDESRVIRLQRDICYLKDEIRDLYDQLNKFERVGYLWRAKGVECWSFSEDSLPASIKPEYEAKEAYCGK